MLIYLPLFGAATITIAKNKIQSGLITICLTIALFILMEHEFSIDNIFILLTVIIIPGALISSYVNVVKNKWEYLMIILTLESLLLKFFKTENLLIFYITFEISLIPLYIIIKIKLNINKEIKSTNRATNLLFIYTLIGSLLILIGLLWLITLNNNIENLEQLNINLWIWILLFVGLAFKIPLLPLHIWLFRAHAEAPVSVSIILSSVILKIATYGYIKLLITNIEIESKYIVPFIEIVLIISLIYTSLSAIRQYDMKALVAISSISHQAIVMIGLFSSVILALTDNNKIALIGPLLLSIGHGFVSPGLFICTGSILYDRYHSRIIYYYRGLNKWIPIFTTLIFILTLINLGIPLTINFYGEILSIISIVKSNLTLGLLTATTIILSALYSILLFGRLNFGIYANYLYFCFDVNRRESYVLYCWIMFVFIIGILPNIVLQVVNI